jgi:hypothetical protein
MTVRSGAWWVVGAALTPAAARAMRASETAPRGRAELLARIGDFLPSTVRLLLFVAGQGLTRHPIGWLLMCEKAHGLAQIEPLTCGFTCV